MTANHDLFVLPLIVAAMLSSGGANTAVMGSVRVGDV